MSNSFRGEARLGETRLQLDINAICALEEATGQDFEVAAKAAESGSMRAMRSMVWALMLRFQPDASLHDAGELISDHGPAAVGETLATLFSAVGGEDAPAGNAPTKARRKPG